jgi:hypothetical protein
MLKPGHEPVKTRPAKQKSSGIILMMVWLVLLGLFIHSLFAPSLLPDHLVVHILARSALIILTWHFIFSPLISFYLKKWLRAGRHTYQKEITEIIQLLPATHYIMKQSWQLSASVKGVRRLSRFCKIVLVNTLPHG